MAKPAANAIPPGSPHLIPYLTMDDSNAAIDWYGKAFGGEVVQKMPGPGGNGVMHAEMKIGGGRVYFADKMGPDAKSAKDVGGLPIVLHLWAEDCDALWNRATAAGAKVRLPMGDMFWGDRYGQIEDPFGYVWAISSQKEELTPEEIGARAAKEFGG